MKRFIVLLSIVVILCSSAMVAAEEKKPAVDKEKSNLYYKEGLKKFREFFPDILGVGVEVPSGNVFMAVLTGGLPMHGDMVSGLIDQP